MINVYKSGDLEYLCPVKAGALRAGLDIPPLLLLLLLLFLLLF